ncbi:MAG TPA: BtrH N-terminal domain-containing protein, partial [Bacillota bacterium]|nr:BtrH N-terminal domain-containing protein [Bacillota bacterium]
NYYQAPLSEEMLLGLGAGLGFIYWSQKGTTPFLGGRDNMKSFYPDLGARTGVRIEQRISASPAKAEKELVALLKQNQPVMVYGDMAYLPCFNFGADYHFGGHTFVICGYDGRKTVLVSEMEPQAAYLK